MRSNRSSFLCGFQSRQLITKMRRSSKGGKEGLGLCFLQGKETTGVGKERGWEKIGNIFPSFVSLGGKRECKFPFPPLGMKETLISKINYLKTQKKTISNQENFVSLSNSAKIAAFCLIYAKVKLVGEIVPFLQPSLPLFFSSEERERLTRETFPFACFYHSFLPLLKKKEP